MILNDILIELRRIATALETQANISSSPVDMRNKKAETPSMSTSNIEKEQEEEDEKYVEMARERLKESEKEGYFFAEDALEEEVLERL